MKIPRRFSVFLNGSWFFANVLSRSLVQDTGLEKYYKINSKFGVVSNDEPDPKNTMFRGAAGDYLRVDYNNLLAVVSKKQFDILFPKKTQKPAQKPGAESSKRLQDQDFYAENARNQPR